MVYLYIERGKRRYLIRSSPFKKPLLFGKPNQGRKEGE